MKTSLYSIAVRPTVN